jgi:hypothetical protein
MGTTNEQRLDRVLAALERELLEATDAEIREAAAELGIEPDLKGSIAWVGLFFPAKIRPEDVFDPEGLRTFLSRRLTPPGRGD